MMIFLIDKQTRYTILKEKLTVCTFKKEGAMTLKELERDWKQCVLELWDYGEKLALKNLFITCVGEYENGLLFNLFDKENNSEFILKSDEENFCYCKNPETKEWRLIGKLTKIKSEQ